MIISKTDVKRALDSMRRRTVLFSRLRATPGKIPSFEVINGVVTAYVLLRFEKGATRASVLAEIYNIINHIDDEMGTEPEKASCRIVD